MSKNYLNRRNVGYDPIGNASTGGDPLFSRTRRFYDPISAGIMGATTLISGALSSNASKSAAQTQADAATQAAQLQQQTALAGIPILQQAYGQGQQAVSGQQTAQQNYLNNLYNTTSGSQANIYAANTANLFPYTSLGAAGATALQNAIPDLSRSFTSSDLNSYLAPNYQFMLNQGLGATTQQLNVGGGGSNIARGATKFAEDYAGNAYQNAFNNFQTQQNNIYNRLSGIANIGQTANNQNISAGGLYGNQLSNTFGTLAPTSTQLATTTGTNLANLATGLGNNTVGLTTGGAAAGAAGITGAAQANAAGTVGSANALSGSLTNLGQTYALSSLLAPKANTAYGTTPLQDTSIYNPSASSGIMVNGQSLLTQ